MRFPYFKQLSSMECGPTCLRMIAKYYGKKVSADDIKSFADFSKKGVNLLGISEAAENIGFRARGVQITYDQLSSDIILPCILHWRQNHFVVLLPLVSKWKRGKKLTIADPARGILDFTKDEFLQEWAVSKNTNGEDLGHALILEPTAKFYEQSEENVKPLKWGMVLQYLKFNKWPLVQVFIAILLTSFFQLIFPFLTQSLVDTGINTQNLQYITIVLIAQLMLVFSRTIVDFIRSRLLLSISIKINFSLLSDFWIKLTRLPISYFDSYHTGDTLQRLNDSRTIQNFLTGSALNTFFSLFSFVIFAGILSVYNIQLFFIFCTDSILYYGWIRLFLRLRRKINYQTFHLSAKANTFSMQLIQGMQELKINNAENLKRWKWESIQASIFKLNFRNLSYSQIQQAGALFINEGKNVVITFLVAQMVVQGQLTLGAMLAVQYIIGQLNGPIEQFIGFVQNAQDAKMSLERLNEIHRLQDEEIGGSLDGRGFQYLPEKKSILLSNMSFAYPGSNNKFVLKNLTVEIPEGKTTWKNHHFSTPNTICA